MRKALQHLRKCDPVLAAIIDRVGPYRMQYPNPDFHSLARSIVYQQLNGRAAETIFGRVVAALSDPLTPESVLEQPVENLRKLGLSQQKAAYIRDLAARTAQKEIDFPSLGALTNEEILQRLTVVKGVGVWTAQMFLMFSLRRPDVLPSSDFGLRAAIKKAYRLEAMPTPMQVEEFGAAWCPYRTVASWYLWRSLEQD